MRTGPRYARLTLKTSFHSGARNEMYHRVLIGLIERAGAFKVNRSQFASFCAQFRSLRSRQTQAARVPSIGVLRIASKLLEHT